MIQSIFISMVLLISQGAFAGEIYASKDWKAYRDVMTALNKRGCLAETVTEVNNNGVMEKWTLQVVRLADGKGEYSHPVIISFPEQISTEAYYEAQAQSDKSSRFSMTLLQPASGDKSIVASRIKDRNSIVSSLKTDSFFTVNYLSKNGPVKTVDFSLRGSSKTIDALRTACL